MPSSSRAGTVERPEHDREPEDDEDDRPELAPIEVRQVQPERGRREEPAADDEEQDAEDERRASAGVAVGRPGRGSWRRLGRRSWRRLGRLGRGLDRYLP